MKNRITQLFEQKSSDILSIYFTAGFPKLEDTMTILKLLQDSGVDMVEIGMPYSDPLADGPVIQRSSEIALENGMSLKHLFKQIRHMRNEITIPVVLMGYLNPVLQYDIELFAAKAAEIGVDGLILPDLPLFEYTDQYKELFESNNLSNIFLITPQTSSDRLKHIDELSNGFIYVVSSYSITGNDQVSAMNNDTYLQRIKDSNLKSPTVVGFNIKDHDTYTYANKYANGAIIGSAFIKMIEKSTDYAKDIPAFINSIRNK